MIFKEGDFDENADCGEYSDGYCDCDNDCDGLDPFLWMVPEGDMLRQIRELERRPVVPVSRCVWLRRWRILRLKAALAFGMQRLLEGGEMGRHEDRAVWKEAERIRCVMPHPMSKVQELVCLERALSYLRVAPPFAGETAAALREETEQVLSGELEELRATVPPEEIPVAREELAAWKAGLRAKRLAREAEEAAAGDGSGGCGIEP